MSRTYSPIDSDDLIRIKKINTVDNKLEDYPYGEFKRNLLNTDDDNYWWNKIFIPATSMQVGSKQSTTAPTFAVFKADATRTSAYSGLVGIKFLGNTADIWQDAYFNVQLPNSYKVDTNIVPTLHMYFPNPTSGQKLLLEFEYSWFDTAVSEPSITTFNYTLTGSSAYLAAISIPELGESGLTLGSLLCGRISRINKKTSATAWDYPDLTGKSDDNAVTDAYLLGISIDYKCDAVGANTRTEKVFDAPRVTLYE